MLLLPETEPALAIERNMSAVEDIQNEKVGNGDIEVINKKCNGNKEKMKDLHVITIDDVNNKEMIERDEALDSSSISIKSENNDAKPSDKKSTKAISEVNDTEELRENINSPKKGINEVIRFEEETCEKTCIDNEFSNVNCVQTESQINCSDKDIYNVSTEKHETENNSIETFQTDLTKDAEDIVCIKKENCYQNLNDANKESKEQVLEDNKTDVLEESLSTKVDVELVEKSAAIFIKTETKTNETIEESTMPSTKDDSRVIEEPTDSPTKCETITDSQLKENTTNSDAEIIIKSEITNDIQVMKVAVPTTLDGVEVEDKPQSDFLNECNNLTSLCKQLEESSKEADSSEIKDNECNDGENLNKIPDCDSKEVAESKNIQDSTTIDLNDDMDVEEIVEDLKGNNKQDIITPAKEIAPVNTIIDKPVICKLSNTLDILSDDEEEPVKKVLPQVTNSNEKLCINIEDDDDIMLIDEDTRKTDKPLPVDNSNIKEPLINADAKTDSEPLSKSIEETNDLFSKNEQKESTPSAGIQDTSSKINISEKQEEELTNKKLEHEKPLLPDNFLKSAKKNLADMTRDDLEEFCILKIVESIVDRSNLSEIKNKLKSMAQGIEEYRKKAMMLTKQNRDLQVVLKSVQEEQKKMTPDSHITPLKITRSVGMQVFMEKAGARRKSLAQLQSNTSNNVANRPNVRNAAPTQNLRPQKPPASNQPIPVPRLVPAVSPAMKTPSTIPLVNQIAPNKTSTPMPNGIKTPPTQKAAEKRQHNRIMSVTVDLTDDEPPVKMNNNRTSPNPPVRLVPPQNLMANPRPQYTSPVNSPRKVYIPISGPQSQGIRPGQTIMLKTVPTPGMRQRCPTPQVARVPQGTVRVNRIQAGRHPAPLPDAMKQYQPPNWKALPPAPDLKLSKVENGIVISWKIEGYQEDSYEEIASYQLYAYQETSSPPSTALWKKIGDVKALPLPMACTLTQFMAGFKYYFAVRAVDIRSRLGPFSLPGSILLLNKL